jgi:hypothetical protein
MNKRGITLIAQWMIHLILLLLVVTVFLSVNSKIQDNRLHALRAETIDYSFTRNTIVSSSFPLSYTYIIKDPKIKIEIEKEACKIKSYYDTDTSLPVSISCAKNAFVNLNEIIGENTIILSK